MAFAEVWKVLRSRAQLNRERKPANRFASRGGTELAYVIRAHVFCFDNGLAPVILSNNDSLRDGHWSPNSGRINWQPLFPPHEVLSDTTVPKLHTELLLTKSITLAGEYNESY